MIDSKFTTFEQELMDVLLEGHENHLKVLKAQFMQADLKKRIHSGAGMFIHFDVPENLPIVESSPNTFQFGDARIDIEGLKFGAGCILFVEKGRLDFLEVYSFQDDLPREIERYVITKKSC